MNFDPPDTPAARAFRKQIEKANARFGGAEVCHGCRRPLKSAELTYVGTGRRRGHLMCVARCCRHMIKILVGFGVWYAMRDTSASWLADIEPRGRA
jgi:hypothetical protein